MADFTSTNVIMNNIAAAREILNLFRQIYRLCTIVEAHLDRYNTDPDFQAEADHLYTAEQLQEINQMIANVSTLRQAWETNHPEALTEPPPPSLG